MGLIPCQGCVRSCAPKTWLQVSQGKAKVSAMFKTPSGSEPVGSVVAESGCWSMLKGGLTAHASGPVELYFETKNTSIEIWADSISLQSFTQEQWRSHQHQSIEKVRKSLVKILAVDAKGNPLANATVSLAQTGSGFPLGSELNHLILTNPGYAQWFTPRFRVTTFEYEMKWPSTEPSQGKENYTWPDAMLRFCQSNNIQVRGHNIFWSNPNYLPQWARSLSPSELQLAVDRRINSIVRRYAGQLIAWDVDNEDMHFHFFENALGKNVTASIFNKVHQIDSKTILFLNEFNTIESTNANDAASPANFLQKIQQIRSGGYNGPLGIGLQGHFDTPNIPYMRASIDRLGATGLPIWLTEVDISQRPNQAVYLEQVLREAHAHPSVKGIVMWTAWRPQGCYRMCLTDNNFKNLPTGDVVDKLLKEWGQSTLSGTTDSNGQFQARLFHGDYRVTISHPSMPDSSVVARNFEVVSSEKSEQKTVIHVKVSP
ncbi:Anti-sigma-I factor RsgI6 like [Actinidia chinensis var. chinensis]|uniref:Anti-sigma-I factor RsgI6 like n=1 Tax=Actinidia chinensis var. chinensis TaxID=1590841 RepID=A0A2R6RGV1_ACTCC|nr:Anti-sigma-I factor RsgI6 like [Actinidia chinensis var. chinensis]